MRNPKQALSFGLLFGLASLTIMATSGRLAAIRAVDVAHLVATGMCFGAALVRAVTIIRKRA